VPANANALTEARAAGIDTGHLRRWAERNVARSNPLLTAGELARLRDAAGERPRSRADDLARAASWRWRVAETRRADAVEPETEPWLTERLGIARSSVYRLLGQA
jgi:hypothetical protein